MSKSEDRFRELMVELAGLFYTAEAQKSQVSGDFGDEIEALATFQTAAEEFIQVTENQLDDSWRALSGKKRMDAEKMRLHEVFSASFSRFKAEFAKIEDVENCLRDHTNDDDN
jgi:hypothetical protein